MNQRPLGGMFITIEGIDGAGKSTVVEALAEEFDAVVTKEPSRHWTGEQVYRALSDDESPPLTDFFLFMADRVHHIEKTILPALEDGRVVISDRYADSTRAYQREQLQGEVSHSHRHVREYIEEVMEPWNLEPDLVLYIDISVDTSMERCDQGDKYETRENIEMVLHNYHEAFLDRDNVISIDGEQDRDKVIQDCIDVVRGKMVERDNVSPNPFV